MKSAFVLCHLLCLALPGHTQSFALDSLRIERTVKVCQLWGHIQYFHPYVDGKQIDWQRAFTDHIEAIISAESSEAFGNEVQNMLDKLHDPATRVLRQENVASIQDTMRYPDIRFLEDSVLLVSVRDYSDLSDFMYAGDKISGISTLASQSDGIIFDLRGYSDPGEHRGYLTYYFEEILPYLSIHPVHLPGLRSRFHDGFTPENGQTSGGYYSGTYTKNARTISPDEGATDKPIVFIVNANAELPVYAIGLQSIGKARIISVDALSDASVVEIYNFALDDSITVAIRVSTLDTQDPIKADYVFADGISDDEIMQAAKNMINGNFTAGNASGRSEGKSMSKEEVAQGKVSSNFPDLGHRLLAAAKIWTVIDYFFAYKELMESDWEDVLRKSIPQFIAASDSLEYVLAVAEMYTHLQDGHGYISSAVLNEYFGRTVPPIAVSYIEEKPVVTHILPDSIYIVRDISIGDVILEIDGEEVKKKEERISKYLNASNPSALRNYISWRLFNGRDSSMIKLRIQKANGTIMDVSLPRRRAFNAPIREQSVPRYGLPVMRLINKDIGYADLEKLTGDMVSQMFEDFKETKAIIFDMRGYPHGTAWSISPHLTDKKEVFAANFRRYSPMGIQEGNTSHVTEFDQAIPPPQLPYYRGMTVMLIDENTQSQAEHTGLFFRAANGTRFIGSQTAGANGDVTNFEIPGNIMLYFSGHDVRHADGTQLQKVGLVPDIHAKPTIAGFRAGKDEVLDAAIEYLTREINK